MTNSLVNFVRCGQVRYGLVTVLHVLAIEYIMPVAGDRPIRPPSGMSSTSVMIFIMMCMMIPLSIGIQILTMCAPISVIKGQPGGGQHGYDYFETRLGCPSALWFLRMWKISWSSLSGKIGNLIGVLGVGYAILMVLEWPPVGQS
eukprot:8335827-Pyramimonas_sp.AAC.1